jgi:hypothetical protein
MGAYLATLPALPVPGLFFNTDLVYPKVVHFCLLVGSIGDWDSPELLDCLTGSVSSNLA